MDAGVPWKRSKLAHKRELCDHCSSIRLTDIFDKADRQFSDSGTNKKNMPRTKSSQDGILVTSFECPPSQFSACPGCRFFWTMRAGGDDSVSYELRAFSSITCSRFINPNYLMGQKIISYQNAFLGVVPTDGLTGPDEAFAKRGAIYRSISTASRATAEADGIWGREIQNQVDFSVVKEWLEFCTSYHRGHCRTGKKGIKLSLGGFRLINCAVKPPKVEEASLSQKYVALSYVWGQGSSESSGWPKLILDAIEATKSMGFQYLWVDKYCINQDDLDEKRHLISNMATIYKVAEVTIVAAAGSDASHGLPGVGGTPRLAQPKLEVAGMTLVSTLADPRILLQKSTWWTRGWTYQEGVLSRRRLVFLEDQVYWECGSMTTHESIRLPLSSVHTPTRLRMESYMRGCMLSGKPVEFSSFQTKGIADKQRAAEVVEHVSNFTKRDLTYGEDSLRAFEGISDHYSDVKGSLRLLLGIPLIMAQHEHRLNASLGLALSAWIHETDTEEPCRRLHLPSWTWAGWKGAVAWGWLGDSYLPQRLSYRWHLDLLLSRDTDDIDAPEIFILSTTGAEIELSQYLTSQPSGLDEHAQHILCIQNPDTIKKCSITNCGKDADSTPIWKVNGHEARISVSVPEVLRHWQEWIDCGLIRVIQLFWVSTPHWPLRFLIIKRATHDRRTVHWERVGAMMLNPDVGAGDIYLHTLLNIEKLGCDVWLC